MIDEYKIQKFLAKIDWFLTTKNKAYNEHDKFILQNLNELYYLLGTKKYSSLKGYNYRLIIPRRNVESIIQDIKLHYYFTI
uniref:Uncharacterized protein n=1 Tax=viral metagenome TaxID=1070528 RepID=A0A6C0IX74_9ZZZZ